MPTARQHVTAAAIVPMASTGMVEPNRETVRKNSLSPEVRRASTPRWIGSSQVSDLAAGQGGRDGQCGKQARPARAAAGGGSSTEDGVAGRVVCTSPASADGDTVAAEDVSMSGGITTVSIALCTPATPW